MTRDHITAVLTVNAAGEMAPPRCFFRGVRNVAANHLAIFTNRGLIM